jgi:hypothetical protein
LLVADPRRATMADDRDRDIQKDSEKIGRTPDEDVLGTAEDDFDEVEDLDEDEEDDEEVDVDEE